MSIGVAVVGLGFGRLFAHLYDLHPDSRLVALCDPSAEALAPLAAGFPQARVFSALEEVLACPEVDAVHVATPAPLHAEQCLAVMRAGRAVMCAVPAALTEEDCRRLIDAQEATGANYMMAETNAYVPAVLYAEELLAGGEMGEIVHAEADYVHNITPARRPEGTPPWRWGYPPMWYATHSLGPIVKVSRQRVTEVTCFGGGQVPEGYREAWGNPFGFETALFRLSGGATAKVSIGFANVSAYPNELVRFYGTKMSLFAHEQPRCDVLTRGGEAQCVYLPDYRHRLPEPLRVDSPHYNSHPHLVHEWISSIREGREPAVGVREAVAYTLPGLVAHESALQGGKTLPVPDLG